MLQDFPYRPVFGVQPSPSRTLTARRAVIPRSPSAARWMSVRSWLSAWVGQRSSVFDVMLVMCQKPRTRVRWMRTGTANLSANFTALPNRASMASPYFSSHAGLSGTAG